MSLGNAHEQGSGKIDASERRVGLIVDAQLFSVRNRGVVVRPDAHLTLIHSWLRASHLQNKVQLHGHIQALSVLRRVPCRRLEQSQRRCALADVPEANLKAVEKDVLGLGGLV